MSKELETTETSADEQIWSAIRIRDEKEYQNKEYLTQFSSCKKLIVVSDVIIQQLLKITNLKKNNVF